MKRILGILFLSVLSLTSLATTVTAIPPGGDWSDAGTWDGPVPGCYDTILIPAGVTVNVDIQVDLEACPGPVFIHVFGTIHFVMGQKLKLPCNSALYLDPSGGNLTADSYVGSNNFLEICNDVVWKASDGAQGPGVYLKISLLYFTAQLDDKSRTVNLKWATASEINNDYYTIQRSSDAVNWEDILTQTAIGTSSSLTEYSDVDVNPMLGLNYYRLMQTDLDGNYEVFNPVVVNNNGLQFDQQTLVFPNPNGSNSITIFLADFEDDQVEIELISLTGQIVSHQFLNVTDGGFAVLTLDYTPAAGYYSLKASGDIQKLVWH